MRLTAKLFALLLLASCASTDDATPPIPEAFPASWVGRWAGEVRIFRGGEERPGFRIERTITPTEDPRRFSWVTAFDGAAGRQVKRYELVVRDAGAGAYAVDEKNGIVLDARLLGGALFSWFEVRGTRLCVREEVHAAGSPEEWMSYEIVTARTAAADTTGGGEVPQVRSESPGIRQFGRLRRVD